MTDADLKLLNAIVEAMNAAETDETFKIYFQMLKQLTGVY